ncbi:MAG: phosphate ABC transporter substrate-binding protein PstS [Omnitrophica bacterium RIFCSPHIGHO2_02_FULL_63_14]|nr:MAG: phosphate ABC transporter substrate-binding protein PstS [Omnitrophica bacterium RIFCSPHIGHO2_02_FULL_63_14]
MRSSRYGWIGLLVLLGVLVAGTAQAAKLPLVNGAGATFPYPLYSKWFAEYAEVDPTVNFNYQSIGSGGGIKQVLAQTVDFGASDGPMTDDQLRQAPKEILHLPTTLGGVVATYNLPGMSAKLNFTRAALAGIFLGRIKTWNDPELTAANPGVALPSQAIIVVHRSDGSGTTYIWTDFLSKVSPEWAKRVGRGTSVNWPVGLGGKGNEGVAGLVKQMPFAIGYVELGYALHSRLLYGTVENSAGKFVDCTLETVTRAAAGAAANMPADFRVSITNPPGADVYPIASFTWLLVYRHQDDPSKGEALVKFLKWMLEDGQQFAGPLGYAPLPPEVIKLEEAAIATITIAQSQ